MAEPQEEGDVDASIRATYGLLDEKNLAALPGKLPDRARTFRDAAQEIDRGGSESADRAASGVGEGTALERWARKKGLLILAAGSGESLGMARPEVGMSLKEVGRDFSEDDETPRLLDVRGSNAEAVQRAAAEFRQWSETVRAADGSTILLKNPERGSFGTRIKHLLFDNDASLLHADKAKWMPAVPQTVGGAAVRLLDETTGNRIYVRQYPGGQKHLVVVRPDGMVEEQKPFSGALITQFPDSPKSRRTGMKIDWVRPPDGQEKLPPSQGTPPNVTGAAPEDAGRSGKDSRRFQENPGPTSTDSTHPDARQSTFQGGDTAVGGKGQTEIMKPARNWVASISAGGAAELHPTCGLRE